MKHRHGFTIIEVILFLTISSSLTALLLVATGTAIQRQQYREAVQSYASFVRNQYSRIINVQNDRTQDTACPIPGVESAAGSKRGQSECVILGRYISSDDNEGRQYKSYPVYGHWNGSAWQYGLGDEDSTYNAQWGTKTRLADQADGSTKVSILMYRDPDVGNLTMRTDTISYNNNSIKDFFDSPDSTVFDGREICVYDTGWFEKQRQSVSLGARAGSSDAVTVINSSAGCNDA